MVNQSGQPSQLMGELLYIHKVPRICPHPGTVTNEVYKDYIIIIYLLKKSKHVVILLVTVTGWVG